MTLKAFGDMLLDIVLRKQAVLQIRTENGGREVLRAHMYKLSATDRQKSMQKRVLSARAWTPEDIYAITAPMDECSAKEAKEDRSFWRNVGVRKQFRKRRRSA